jgi:hypothetical protein
MILPSGHAIKVTIIQKRSGSSAHNRLICCGVEVYELPECLVFIMCQGRPQVKCSLSGLDLRLARSHPTIMLLARYSARSKTC